MARKAQLVDPMKADWITPAGHAGQAANPIEQTWPWGVTVEVEFKSSTVAGAVKLEWGTNVGSLLPPAMTHGIKVIMITGKQDHSRLKSMKDGAKTGPKRPRHSDGRGPTQFPAGGSYRRGGAGR